jgi:HAD superfamily hydrolase (TIGR01509 family)
MSDGQRTATGLAALDAVTIDGYGTLLTIHDPIGHLDRELRARGVALPRSAIERGFSAEGEYYREAKIAARDEESLATLRAECARVLLDTAGADLDAVEFASVLVYEFETLPGVPEALARLAAHGLALAVVADWDYGLHEHLGTHRLDHYFAAVVTSAEVGAAKPSPAPFLAALDRLGVEPARALHIGDHPRDEEGAAAAGMHFAPAPLDEAVQRWLA